jgi:hypothetical protein
MVNITGTIPFISIITSLYLGIEGAFPANVIHFFLLLL